MLCQPASPAFLAPWGDFSWFQSVRTGTTHAVAKTMQINERHSLLGDPWKAYSAGTERQEFWFHFGQTDETIRLFPISSILSVEMLWSIFMSFWQGCTQHHTFPARHPRCRPLKFIIGDLLQKRVLRLCILVTRIYTLPLSDLYTSAVIKAQASKAHEKVFPRRSPHLNRCLVPRFAPFLPGLGTYPCSCIFSAPVTAK